MLCNRTDLSHLVECHAKGPSREHSYGGVLGKTMHQSNNTDTNLYMCGWKGFWEQGNMGEEGEGVGGNNRANVLYPSGPCKMANMLPI